jgi:hypothetical protein
MAKVYGRQAKVLWTPGTGGEDLRRSSSVLLDCIAVRGRWPLKLADITPLGDAEEAVASMGTAGRVVLLRLDARHGSPSILPSHVPGTLRLYETRHLAEYRQGSAIVERLEWGAEAEQPGQPQHQWYAMRFSGEVVDDAEDPPELVTASWNSGTETLTLTYSAAVLRHTASIVSAVTVIDASGAKFVSSGNATVTVNGTSVTIGPTGVNPGFDEIPGAFTPISTVSLAASLFKSSAYPDDTAMVVAADSNHPLT